MMILLNSYMNECKIIFTKEKKNIIEFTQNVYLPCLLTAFSYLCFYLNKKSKLQVFR